MGIKYLTLRNIRRLYAVFFLLLFVALIVISDFRNMKGYEVALFLELDPLVAVTTFLTSWTVYLGLALSLIILLGTLLLGRFFCSWVCPLGVINHTLSHFFNRKRPVDDYAMNEYRPLFRLKYLILTVLLVLALFGGLQIGLFDPIALLTRSMATTLLPAISHWGSGLYLRQPLFHGGMLIALIFVAILFANRIFTRFWCRVVCPLGALLGVVASRSLLRIHRDVEKCTDCKKCLRHCHGGCDPHTALRVSECVLCMNCIPACPEGALHYGLAKEDSARQAGIDVNRRRLLETAVASAILFPMMRSVLGSASVPDYRVVRPPGALLEEDFLRRCLKCGQCMRVCPTNVIQPALLEAGFEGLWTPVLINKMGYCEFNCVLCGQVCPTGAILPLSVEKKTGKKPYARPMKIGTAFYDRGRCLPWAMNTDCIVCEEMCPVSPKAIWFESVEVTLRDGRKKTLKRPHVDPARCTGCGICENKCPVHDLPAVRVTSVGEVRSPANQMILAP